MATRQDSGSETSEIVGVISKFAGSVVGTATTIGKKVARGVRGVATGREKALRERVAALESELAAMRRKLKKARGAKKEDKKPKKKKTEPEQAKIKKRKTEAGKKSSHPQNCPTSGAGSETEVATQTQKSEQPVPDAAMSDTKSSKIAGPTDSGS